MPRSAFYFLSSSLCLAFFAVAGHAGLAQSTGPLPAAQPDSVITEPQPDAHEGEAMTRSVSQIRIVRLSQVRGQVELDRSGDLKGGEQKFEDAFPNLPVVAGERLRTKEGVAEVEFEDNSSLRLVTDSQVSFPELGRAMSGETNTAIDLVHGSIYMSLANSKSTGTFAIHAGGETITPAPGSHFHLETTEGAAKLTVLQGTVTAAGQSGSLAVGKHKAIAFDLKASAAPVFVKLDEPSTFDDWDKSAVDYHKTLAVTATYANSPYSYGMNDLAYYGAFSDVGGCGTMWRPYLATASFDPYASGLWAWYPASGYSWVSPYPWGWTPFHSGSWNYCQAGGGWGWRPDGGWAGLQNAVLTTVPLKAGKPGLPLRPVPRPPSPPVRGHSTLLPVNLNQMQISKPGAGDSFVFQGGSAGLGVPRGAFRSFAKASEHAAQHGFATTSVSEIQASRSLLVTTRMSASASAGPGQAGMMNRAGGESSAMNRNSAVHASAGGAGGRSAGPSMGNLGAGAASSMSSLSSAGSGSRGAGGGAAPAGGGSHH